MTRTLSLSLGIVMLVAGVHAGPAWAQDGPNRAFRGLFGGNDRNVTGPSQTLDFRTDMQGGHDDNVLADAGSAEFLDPRYQVGGDYAATNMSLTYATAAAKMITITGRVAGDMRYSPPAVQGLSDPRYDGALSIGLQKTIGIMTATARQSASYSPFRVLTPFPRFTVQDGIPVVVGHDFGISSHEVIGINSEGRLGFQMGRRTTFDVGYRRMMTDYSGLRSKILDQNLGGNLGYRLTRHAVFRLGYSYRLASYSGSPSDKPIGSQTMDAGVDFNRPLSLTRKTAVNFTSGTASASDGRNLQYYVTGGAGVNQEIGRSWRARMMFSRSLSFLDGFSTPFIQNGATSDIGGYLGRRVDFSLTAAYANADSTLSTVASKLTTYTASTRLQVALNRYASVYGQYFYYQYRFRDAASAIAGLPPMMERRGFRGGLTMWLPLLR